jgi:hypothetical protein
MDILQLELQKAIEYVRQTFAAGKVTLDYSPASIKQLDKLFETEFKNGKLKNADGSFGKYQGLILTGVSGYIAETIIKNTGNTQLIIDPADANWFMNFKVANQTGLSIHPGQRVIKRMLKGAEMELYAYTIFSVSYFSMPAGVLENSGGIAPDDYIVDTNAQQKLKPWWKFW